MDEYFSSYEGLLDSSIAFSGESHEYFDRYKINCIDRYFGKQSTIKNILDFGCGTGRFTASFSQMYLDSMVYGYDVSKKAISIAKTKNKELKNQKFVNHLVDDIKFDLITAINVFHHIKKDKRKGELKRLKGMLNTDGHIVIFEHNPFNILTQYIVKRCPLDNDAELIPYRQLEKLALSCSLKVSLKRYIIFFPHFLKILRPVEHYLGPIPLGAQYMAVFSINERPCVKYQCR